MQDNTIPTSPASDRTGLEKAKLLYELAHIQWVYLYRDIPESLKNRLTKLIPLLLICVFFTPQFFQQVVRYADFPVALLFSLGLLVLLISIFYTIRVLFSRQLFTLPDSTIQKALENESLGLEEAYRVTTAELTEALSTKAAESTRLTKEYKLAIASFFLSLVLGLVTYFVKISMAHPMNMYRFD